MYAIVAVGILTIFLSLVMATNPAAWSRGIILFAANPYFHIFEIMSRLILGGILLFFAGDTLYPQFLSIVGGLFIFAGLFLVVAGQKRHLEFAARTATFTRIFRPAGLVGILFGTFLVYSALAGRSV